MARNTDPAPCRRGRARARPRRGIRGGLACVSPGAAVVVRAVLGEELARLLAGFALLVPLVGLVLLAGGIPRSANLQGVTRRGERSCRGCGCHQPAGTWRMTAEKPITTGGW